MKPVVGQYLAGVLPGEPILAAAMQHQDRGSIGRPGSDYVEQDRAVFPLGWFAHPGDLDDITWARAH